MRVRGLAVCTVLVACIGPREAAPRQSAPIEAYVVHSEHAPTIDVPWWWRGATPPDGATCQRVGEGGVGVLGGDEAMAALLVIDGESLRLADTTVLALTDGVVPPGARDGATIVPLAAAMAVVVERQKAYLDACGRTGDPIDVLLAAAPDTPQHTILAVMYTVIRADVERVFFAVGGGAEGKRWTSGFAVEEEELVLTLDGHRWRAGIDWNREHDVPISDLAGVQELLNGRPLGCATVPLRLGEPWVRAIGELDVLAGLGAHQFTIEGGQEHGFPVARASGVPGERISVRVGGTVAALPHQSPKIYALDRRDGDRHVRRVSPCVGWFAETAVPPTPEEIETTRRALGLPEGDVWDPLPGPKQPGP